MRAALDSVLLTNTICPRNSNRDCIVVECRRSHPFHPRAVGIPQAAPIASQPLIVICPNVFERIHVGILSPVVIPPHAALISPPPARLIISASSRISADENVYTEGPSESSWALYRSIVCNRNTLDFAVVYIGRRPTAPTRWIGQNDRVGARIVVQVEAIDVLVRVPIDEPPESGMARAARRWMNVASTPSPRFTVQGA